MKTTLKILFSLYLLLSCGQHLFANKVTQIHLFKPNWNQAKLNYRQQSYQAMTTVDMKLSSKGWWLVEIEAKTLEFSFSNGEQIIDLGRTLGCYDNDHYDCNSNEHHSKLFRSNYHDIWVKNGLLFIANPENKNAQKEILTTLTLNLHTYQEFSTKNKNEEQLSELDVQQRVAAYANIFDNIAEAINQLDPDAICLQEVGEWVSDTHPLAFGEDSSNAVRQILQRLDGHQYYSYMDWSHYGWGIWKEGSAILSKYPFKQQSSRYISLPREGQKSFWKSRKVPSVQIDIPKLGAINLFSVHAGWWNDEEEPFQRQFKNLMAWIKQNQSENESTLLCGDFNQPAGSEGYQLMVGSSGFSDQYLKANPGGMDDATIGGRIAGWENSSEGKRVDYILLNNDSSLEVIQSQRIFTEHVFGRVSDHLGIYAQFKKR